MYVRSTVQYGVHVHKYVRRRGEARNLKHHEFLSIVSGGPAANGNSTAELCLSCTTASLMIDMRLKRSQ